MDSVKKYLLYLIEEEPNVLIGEVATACGFEIITNREHLESGDIICVITDDKNYNGDFPWLYIGDKIDPREVSSRSLVGAISNKVLEFPIVSKILMRAWAEESSLQIETAYEGELKEAHSYKITEGFSFGYYGDLVAKNSARIFDETTSVRNYYHNLSMYLTSLMTEDLINYPIEMDLGLDEGSIFLQTHFHFEDFKAEFLEKSGFFQNLFYHSDLVDCYYLESSKKLVITSFWFQGNLDGTGYIANNIKKFSMADYKSVFEVDFNKIEQDEKVEDFSLKKYRDREIDLGILRRVFRFVKAKLKERDLTDISLEEIVDLIATYPNRKIRQQITEEDEQFIFKCIKEDSFAEAIFEDSNMDRDIQDVFSDVVLKLKNMSLADADEMVRVSGNYDPESENNLVRGVVTEDESFTRVGGKIEEDESFVRVEGQIEEDESFVRVGGKIEEDDSFVRISGTREDLAEKAWKIKRLKMAEELEKKRGSIQTAEDLKNAVDSVVQDNIEGIEEEGELLAAEIVEDARISSLQEALDRVDGEVSSSNEKEILDLKNKVEGKNHQLLRMKKIIDTLKNQVQAQKKVDSATDGVFDDSVKLELLQNEIKKQETNFKKQKELLENVITSKNQEINNLKNAESEVVEVDSNVEDLAKISSLEKENERLLSQLEIAEKRLTSASENMEKRGERQNELRDNEMKVLRENFEKVNSDYEAMKREKSMLEAKSKNFELIEKGYEKEVRELRARIDGLNEDDTSEELVKLKAENLKFKNTEAEAGRKFRGYEQKIKFLNAKIEELTKSVANNKNAANAASGSGGATKVSDAKVKQLEKVVDKIKDSNQKAQDDLVAQKAETLKYKKEVTVLTNKIQELERKVKKAA